MPKRPPQALHITLLLSWIGAALACPAAVAAQASVPVNRYSPGVLLTDGFAVRRPKTLGHLRVAGQLQLDFSLRPLVFDRVLNDRDPIPLVETQLTSHTSVALGLMDYGVVFVGMPVHLMLDGESLPGQTTATGFGAGDLYFGVRGGVMTRAGFGGGGRIAISTPTGEDAGDNPSAAGESTSTLTFAASAEMPVRPLALVGNVGLRFRQDKIVGTTRFSDEIFFGGAAAFAIPELLDIYLEIVGTASTENIAGGATTSLEAGLGTKVQLGRSWMVGVRGGAGLAPAYGTPIMRAIMLVGYQMPAEPRQPETPDEHERQTEWQSVQEREQQTDEPAETPEEAAVVTTADDPASRDSDGDGLSDLDDRCPMIPGDSSEFGCARHLTYAPETGRFVFSRGIEFGRRTTQLKRRSGEVLDELARAILANEDFRVRVDSHTLGDGLGPLEAMLLTQRRASVVAAQLVERGVAADRIKATGCSTARPITSSHGSGRARNERVEVWVLHPLPKAGMPSTLGCQPSNPPTAPQQ